MGLSAANQRQDMLFNLFDRLRANGAPIVPVSAVDDAVDSCRPATLLKHDVHDVDLDAMISLAERENAEEILGTYLFMPEGHPRTRRRYNFEQQLDAARAILSLGHDVGLHIDPFFQIQDSEQNLYTRMTRIKDSFSSHGILLRIGNMHGNSRFKHPDVDGYGTSFDLFAEIERQPDYPDLSRLLPESAALIRANRLSLRDLGFTHWADLPVWSARHGIVASNFLSDNRLGTDGTLELLIRDPTAGAWYLSPRAVPGSRELAEGGRRIEVAQAIRPVSGRFRPYDPGLESVLPWAVPILFLVHPEFYC